MGMLPLSIRTYRTASLFSTFVWKGLLPSPYFLLFAHKGLRFLLTGFIRKGRLSLFPLFVYKGLQSLFSAIHLQRTAVLDFCYSFTKDCCSFFHYKLAKDLLSLLSTFRSQGTAALVFQFRFAKDCCLCFRFLLAKDVVLGFSYKIAKDYGRCLLLFWDCVLVSGLLL